MIKCRVCKTTITKANALSAKSRYQGCICRKCLVLQYRANNKAASVLIKREVFEHYSGNPPRCMCPKCHVRNIKFLTIDHINGGGTKHAKKIGVGHDMYAYLKNHGFPKGIQILCYNCNCGRAKNNGLCPHMDNKRSE